MVVLTAEDRGTGLPAVEQHRSDICCFEQNTKERINSDKRQGEILLKRTLNELSKHAALAPLASHWEGKTEKTTQAKYPLC